MNFSRVYGIKGRLLTLTVLPCLLLAALVSWLAREARELRPAVAPPAATHPLSLTAIATLREALQAGGRQLNVAYLNDNAPEARNAALRELTTQMSRFETARAELLATEATRERAAALTSAWTELQTGWRAASTLLQHQAREYDVQARYELTQKLEPLFLRTSEALEAVSAVATPLPEAPLVREGAAWDRFLFQLTFVTAAGLGLCLLLGLWVSLDLGRALARLVAALGTASVQVTGAATRVLVGQRQVPASRAHSTKVRAELTSTIESLAASTRREAEARQAILARARADHQVAEASEGGWRELAQALFEITQNAQRAETQLQTLDEMAFQSNLLALNGAVEAVRAGEAGKGIMVIMEELRALAQRSAHSAKDALEALRENARQAERVGRAAQMSSASLRELGRSLRDAHEQSADLAAAGAEQTQELVRIAQSLGELESHGQREAREGEELISTLEELARQAIGLHQLSKELTEALGGSPPSARGAETGRASSEPAIGGAAPASTPATPTTHQTKFIALAGGRADAPAIAPLDDKDDDDFPPLRKTG
jgi:methyl-accepting chemotaxis protein